MTTELSDSSNARTDAPLGRMIRSYQIHHGGPRSLLALVATLSLLGACEPVTEMPPARAPDTVTPAGVTTTSGPDATSVPSPAHSGSASTSTSSRGFERIYYTFKSTLECDPANEQAALQVVQAFVTAYNERNLDRLEQLASQGLNEIWDPSGLPHTGQVLNTDLARWARASWEVDDYLAPLKLIDYGPQAGSDVTLLRSNRWTKDLGIEGVVVVFKVPSSGCTINRLVGHLVPGAVENCPFFALYEVDLEQELTADWQVPSTCRP